MVCVCTDCSLSIGTSKPTPTVINFLKEGSTYCNKAMHSKTAAPYEFMRVSHIKTTKAVFVLFYYFLLSY